MEDPLRHPAPSAAPSPSNSRAGVTAFVGRANVGKSSLINALLGEKITIVSPVAQTTWHRVRGVLNEPRGQVALIDTPGVLRAEHELGRWINRAARRAANGADLAVLVQDVSRPPRDEDAGWVRRFATDTTLPPVIVVLNKADMGDRGEADLRGLWPAAAGRLPVAWVKCSATTGEGLSDLLDAIFARLPAHPPLFPDDVLTDFPRKLFLADVIREKLCLRLRDELPHRTAVEVTDVRDTDDGALEVRADVWVERSSQKPIVIGYKGRLLRAIRRAAEAELTAIYERPVRIDLCVVVREKWTRNFWRLKSLGLDL